MILGFTFGLFNYYAHFLMAEIVFFIILGIIVFMFFMPLIVFCLGNNHFFVKFFLHMF